MDSSFWRTKIVFIGTPGEAIRTIKLGASFFPSAASIIAMIPPSLCPSTPTRFLST